ncbi:MAG: SAM-dependent methyltransferase [Cyclobacteriaceae bacterium]
MLNRFISILGDKVLGKKKDYFLDAKYTHIRKYYGNTVLDVGAGNGDFSQFLESKSHRVKAIDVTNQCQHAALDFSLFDG